MLYQQELTAFALKSQDKTRHFNRRLVAANWSPPRGPPRYFQMDCRRSVGVPPGGVC